MPMCSNRRSRLFGMTSLNHTLVMKNLIILCYCILHINFSRMQWPYLKIQVLTLAYLIFVYWLPPPTQPLCVRACVCWLLNNLIDPIISLNFSSVGSSNTNKMWFGTLSKGFFLSIFILIGFLQKKDCFGSSKDHSFVVIILLVRRIFSLGPCSPI